MVAVSARSILDKASFMMNDVAVTRWPHAQTLEYLNDSIEAIIAVAPSAGATFGTLTVPANTCTVSLPENGVSLISVQSVAGRAVRHVERELLDSRYPNWRTTSENPTKAYVYSKDNPKHFYLWPQYPVSTSVIIEYVKLPTRIINENDPITIPSEYAPAILNGVLSMAYAVDTEPGSIQKAQAYAQMMVTLATGGGAIPIKADSDEAQSNALNPNVVK